MRIFFRLAFLCVLLLSGLYLFSETGCAQPSPAPRDLAALQAEYSALDKTRLAAPLKSKERAEAATKTSRAAGDIAWLLWEKNQSETAATWFARQNELSKEAYGYWEEYLSGEVVTQEKTFRERAAQWREKIAGAANEKDKAEFKATANAFVLMQHTSRYAAVSQLQTLARENEDWPTLLKYSLQELSVRQSELDDLKSLEAAPREIAIKQTEIAKSYERIAAAQGKLARFEDAEKSLAQALNLRAALPDDIAQKQLYETYLAMGALHLHEQGDYRRAHQEYSRALQEFEAAAPQRRALLEAEKSADNKDMTRAIDVLTEFNIVANLGSVAQEAGEYSAAEKFLARALTLSGSLPAGGYIGIFDLVKSIMRARALGDYADLHAAIGETDRAAQELDEVIQIKQAAGEAIPMANALQQAAYLKYANGDLKIAKQYVIRARTVFAQRQNLQSFIAATSFLSTVARESGEIEDAATYAENALPLARQTNNFAIIGGALRTLAAVRLQQKRFGEASTLLDEAATCDAKTGSILNQIANLGWQGQVLEAQNQNDAALQKYLSAVNLLENIREGVSGENFGENKSTAKAYERLVLLLLKMNRGQDAFDYLQRARSKQTRESLRLSSLKSRDPKLQALLDRASTLESQLQTTRGQLQNEQAKPAAEQDTQKIESYREIIASTQGQYLRVISQIKTGHADKKIFNVDPKQIKETQDAIPPDTALIQYAPLQDKFYILLVTRDSLRVFATPTKPEELWRRINAVRRQIARPAQNHVAIGGAARGASLAPQNDLTKQNDQAQNAAQGEESLQANLSALYKILIAPIEAEIQDKSTLALVPSQLLYYLPMHALVKDDGKSARYLVQDKKIIFLSSTDLMRFMREKPDKNSGGLIAFGDPTGAALPAARDEVQTIAKIFPGAQTLVGSDASKTAALSSGALDKRVVHFATHGILNPTDPTLSYIQLSKAAPNAAPENFQLTVGEVWDLPLRRVELVTLSACETALAQNSPAAGDDITTLAEAFSLAGAQTVVATLWSVADESTRAWMVEFYSQLAARKPKGEAFRAAQLKLLNSPEYSQPYYWAPFILMGDWR